MLNCSLQHLRATFKPRTLFFLKSAGDSIGCGTLRRWIILGFALALAVPNARPDTVTLNGRLPFRGVRVLSFQDGRLAFVGLAGETLRKDIREVARLEIDGLADLTAAEAIWAAGRPREALPVYHRALEADLEPWRRQLILARAASAADESESFELAVSSFVRLAVEQPDAAERIRPWRVPEPDDAGFGRARDAVDGALQGTRHATARQVLRNYSLELGLYATSRVVPPPSQPVPGAAADGSHTSSGTEVPADTAAAGRDQPPRVFGEEPDSREAPEEGGATAPPRLFGGESGDGGTGRTSGAGGKTRSDRGSSLLPRSGPGRRASSDGLPADTVLLRIAGRAFERGDAGRAVGVLEAALSQLAPERQTEARLLLARARIEAGQAAVAAAELAAMAESESEPLVVAEAHYYLGIAHEQLGRADVAQRSYRGLLEPGAGTDEIRALARLRLERMSGSEP